MSTKAQQKLLQQKLKKINNIYEEFSRELDRLKKERRQIIADIHKRADNDKISAILKSIK
jgi:glutamate mutase epsilon subunit